MAYPKGKSMNSPVGIYSSKSNPMGQPARVPKGVGPGSNPDQSKVNKLLMQAHNEVDYLRGKSGM